MVEDSKSVPDLSGEMQLNHEWTLINTNKDADERAVVTFCEAGQQMASLFRRAIRCACPFDSCGFVSIRGFPIEWFFFFMSANDSFEQAVN